MLIFEGKACKYGSTEMCQVLAMSLQMRKLSKVWRYPRMTPIYAWWLKAVIQYLRFSKKFIRAE